MLKRLALIALLFMSLPAAAQNVDPDAAALIDAQTGKIEALTDETRAMRGEVAGHETRLNKAEDDIVDGKSVDTAIGAQIIDIWKEIDKLKAVAPDPEPTPEPEPEPEPTPQPEPEPAPHAFPVYLVDPATGAQTPIDGDMATVKKPFTICADAAPPVVFVYAGKTQRENVAAYCAAGGDSAPLGAVDIPAGVYPFAVQSGDAIVNFTLTVEEEVAGIPDPAPPSTGPPAPDHILAYAPPTVAGKPSLLLGLDNWKDGIEDPFVNIARGFGNGWGAGQNWKCDGCTLETMDMAALSKGGFIDSETMLPTAIPAGFDYIRTPLFRGGARYDPEGYAGTYVVEWDGEATARAGLTCAGDQKVINAHRIEFTCTKNDKDWTNVQFTAIGPGGLKDVRIFRKKDEADIRAGAIFRRQWLDYAAQYSVLRTMDIQGASIAGMRSVDQLSKKSHAQWASVTEINYAGLPMGPPIEVLADMAVASDTALWAHVAGPIGASARFDEIAIGGTRHRENFEQKLQMQWAEEEAPQILASPEWDKFADEVVRSLTASGYPADRPFYLETRNEVWNNANPWWWGRDYFLGIRNWVNAQKPVDGYSAMVGVGYMEGRAAEAIEAALARAGRKQQVVFVLECQHANPTTCEGALIGFKRYFEDRGADPKKWLAHAGVSTATYFHDGTGKAGLFPSTTDEELRAKWLQAIASDPQGTAKALTDFYLTKDQCCTVPYLVRMRKAQEAVADKYGALFIGDYEGLTHDAAWEPLRSDPNFKKWYFDVWMNGQEGERLTREWVKALYAENSTALIANYKGICPQDVQYPWCDGLYGQRTGVRNGLSEFLRN